MHQLSLPIGTYFYAEHVVTECNYLGLQTRPADVAWLPSDFDPRPTSSMLEVVQEAGLAHQLSLPIGTHFYVVVRKDDMAEWNYFGLQKHIAKQLAEAARLPPEVLTGESFAQEAITRAAMMWQPLRLRTEWYEKIKVQ